MYLSESPSPTYSEDFNRSGGKNPVWAASEKDCRGRSEEINALDKWTQARFWLRVSFRMLLWLQWESRYGLGYTYLHGNINLLPSRSAGRTPPELSKSLE